MIFNKHKRYLFSFRLVGKTYGDDTLLPLTSSLLASSSVTRRMTLLWLDKIIFYKLTYFFFYSMNSYFYFPHVLHKNGEWSLKKKRCHWQYPPLARRFSSFGSFSLGCVLQNNNNKRCYTHISRLSVLSYEYINMYFFVYVLNFKIVNIIL